MSKTKKYVFLMFILPWFSIPFIRKSNFKRFLPGALAMCIYVAIEGYFAEKKKWWWFFFRVRPNVLGEFPLILGPFFIGSIWILKYTFGHFKKYLIVNLIIDSFFTYYMVDWFKKIGYATIVRVNKTQLSLIFLIKSFVMYGFQYMYEKYFSKGKAFNNINIE